MKKLFLLLSIAAFIALFGCDISSIQLSDNSLRQREFYRTEGAWQEVNFMDYAQPIVFGVSTRADTNSIVLGGNTSGFSGRQATASIPAAPNPGIIPDDSVEIRSESGRGKIAGSEDGITFYYKEVSADKNFRMQADFKVISFLPPPPTSGGVVTGDVAPNGQEAWGIMARDFIPQYSGKNMDEIEANTLAQRLNRADLSTYYISGTSGGDSNMIMVGGVKRGIRAYWRRGVAYNGITPLSSGQFRGNGNPAGASAMDHTNTNFYYWPREWGNYSELGDAQYLERPDFPRYYDKNNPDRDISYRLTLERNNNGFFWTIEYPNEGIYPSDHEMSGLYRKGRIRDRTARDPFNRDIVVNPNERETRPIIDPIDRGSIPPYEDILKSVNTENYYVGFFAARDAVVWVSNIKYWEADVDACDPEDPITPSKLNPTFEILTPEIYTGINYLHIKTNIPGQLIVNQDRQQIPNSVIQNTWVAGDTGSAVAHNMFTIPVLPLKDGDNTFTMTFYPNSDLPEAIAKSTYEGVVLGSNAAINRTFVIKKKVYQNGTGDIFVSNNGAPRNNGTRGSPLDLQTAITYVQPGQDIVMLDGVYMLQDTIVIPRYNDGAFGAYKTLRAENRHKVALDWSWKKDPANNRPPFVPMRSRAFQLNGNYWKLEGFHVRNAPDDVKGMEIGGSNNIISWLTIYSNGETGFQIAGNSNEPTRYWPSNNRVEYCESFNNRDPANTNADGFAAKLTVGKDNIFYRCIGHSNVDDGWDFFAKRETGPIGIITLEECIAYGAGVMSVKQPNGTWVVQYFGNNMGSYTVSRNGFKMGGEGISVKHLAIHSVSFGNDGNAFTSNSNPSIILINSTSIGTSGNDVSKMDIRGNAGTAVDGYEEFCISTGGTYDINKTSSTNINVAGGVNSIMFPVSNSDIDARSLDGYDGYQGRFMKRKADGRPDLGSVFKSNVPGVGAWRLYD